MTKQRAFANQERAFQVQRAGKLGRALLMWLATALTFATIALLAADQLYRPNEFVISQLKVKGKFTHFDPVSVDVLLQGQNLGNFFSVELDAVKRKVEALPWVQSVDVRREWPNTLEVTIVEQRPVMRWGKSKWVSATGDVIELPDDVIVSNVITLHGTEANAAKMLRAARAWRQTLQASDLQLKAVTLSTSQAWTLHLYSPKQASSFDLLLGREAVAERLVRFQYLYAKQFQQVDHRLLRVDARYPDGLAVRSEKIEPPINRDDAVAANN